MRARFYVVAAMLAISARALPAQDQPVPCGSCIALSVALEQVQRLPPNAKLSGLTVLLTLDEADPAAVTSALQRLQDGGATAGFFIRDLATALKSPARFAAPLALLDVSSSGAVDERLAFDVKTLATALRAADTSQLGIALAAEQLPGAAAAGLAPYFDYVVLPPVVTPALDGPFRSLERWVTAGEGAERDLAGLLTSASRAAAARTLLPLPAGREPLVPVLAVLARTVPSGLASLREVQVECDGGCRASVYLDASTLDAVALVRPRAPSWWVRVKPTAAQLEAVFLDEGGEGAPGVPETSWRARTEGSELLLPAVAGPFVLRVRGWQGGETGGFATGVDVSAPKTLRVEEIVARHQTAAAGARRAVHHLISVGTTVLTFDAPGFAAPLAITAATTVFTSGGSTEVSQREIRVNGLALATRGDEVPRLPIIEPERVTTPPLTIALTEAYRYRLAGQESLAGRPCYVVAFTPRQADRTLFEGRAWIDKGTFGIVRLDAAQVGLPGPVVASREIHDFQPTTEGGVTAWLPSRSEIHQVYETATFSTPIHRVVTFARHLVNPVDYAKRLEEAYRSDAVMMRDTPQGYRYLRRDSKPGTAVAGRQVIADRVQRVRTVAGGVTIDPNISIPLVFAGISYVNFNVLGSGAQLDAFFGGTYGRLAWSSPPIGRSGWRAAGEAFGLAVSYNDRAFRAGFEQYRENVAQRPLHVSAGMVGPIAAGLRVRAAYEMDYTWYARSDSTSASFAVPASTPVHAVRLTLERQRGPWTIAASVNRAWRQRWTSWGWPSAREPVIRAFDRVALRAARSFVWSPRLVGRVDAQWMGGRHLDRFSRYAFGTFDNPLRGYPSASIRYDRGAVVRSAVSWSAAPRLRLDVFGDAAYVRDPGLSSRHRPFPGVGAAVEAPLPFSLLTSLEWGYGFRGINGDGTRGTQVIKVSVYKAF